jgi:hypothetical protein
VDATFFVNSVELSAGGAVIVDAMQSLVLGFGWNCPYI